MILTPLEAVVGMGFNFISRRFEWEADRFVWELQNRLGDCEMVDMGDRLGRTLVTLHVKNLSTIWLELAVSLALVLVITDSIFVVQLLGISPVTLR